jgi:hypothetical protein
MRSRVGLLLLLPILVGVSASCVEVPDPTVDEMDPGRHARETTRPPSTRTFSVFDLDDPYVPPSDPYP